MLYKSQGFLELIKTRKATFFRILQPNVVLAPGLAPASKLAG
jgi:hypothetical protein